MNKIKIEEKRTILNEILGNRCKHNPNMPQLDISISLKNQPPLIHYATKKIKEYYYKPFLLPELNFINGTRQQRSERREAIIKTVSVLLRYYDQVTEKIGIPYLNKFYSFSIKKLAGIADLSCKRFIRALRDLKRAKFFESKYMGKNQVSIKKLTAKLFRCLGLGLRYNIDRSKAKRRRKQTKSENNIFARTLNVLINNNKFIKRNLNSKKPNKVNLEFKKKLELKKLELWEKYPDWNKNKIEIEAKKLLE